jgi:FHS family glucose/mannose:H+ symporter-like MFS transporter
MQKQGTFTFTLCSLYFLFALLLNSVGIVIHKSLHMYGIDEVSASSLEAYKDLPIALVSLVAGSLLPRLGHRLSLQLCLWLVSAACLLLYLHPSFINMKILFAAVGVSFAGTKISLYTLARERTGFIHSIEAWFMLGVASAFWVFPLFFEEDQPLAWTRIYLVLSFLFGVAALLILSYAFPPMAEAGLKAVGSTLKSPVLWGFGACAFFYVMVEQGIMTWLPTFNERALAISETWSVRLSVLLSLSLALGRLAVAQFFPNVSWLKVLLLCLAGSLLLLVLPSISSSPLFTWGFPWIGLFLGPIYPLISTAVMSSTAAERQATYAALLVFFSALGGSGGARIMGYWFRDYQGSYSFIALAAPVIFLLLSAIFLSKSISALKPKN